ncbi:MAG: HAD-IA family hydrolase [Alphaproteobacteria bacterium]|nr:HAD-IA family hydrolase [Alphaproteobacteria bacterium]
MRQKQDIKLCLLDCGGVVYPYSLEPFYKCLSQYGIKQNSLHLKWRELMLGEITVSDFYKDISCLSGFYFDDKIEKELNLSLLKGVGQIYQETKEVMSYLKGKNIKIGLLSNALPQLSSTVDNLLFDKEFIFPSYQLNALKPDELIFKKVQEQTKIPFQNILFIDDKKENVHAALQLGIKSLVYNPKTVLNDVKRIVGEKNVRCSCNRRCNCR